MAQSLPFQTISNAQFGRLYSSSPRTLDLLGVKSSNDLARTITVAQRQKPASRALGSLSELLLQPLDIIYEVFSHLHPLDLYNLCRSNGHLKKILLQDSCWTWSISFENHPNIPPRPDDISYNRWCSLLFGPYECESCRTEKATPDWVSRRRLCVQCASLQDGLILSADDAATSNDSAQVGQTSSINSEHPQPQYTIQGVADRLSAYRRSVPSVIPRRVLRERLAKNPQAAVYVQRIASHVKICKSWVKLVHKEAKFQRQKQSAPMIQWLEKRLSVLHYVEEDINEVSYTLGKLDYYVGRHLKTACRSFRELRRRWKIYLPALKQDLDNIAEIRRRDTEERRMETRAADIQVMYERVQDILYAQDPVALEDALSKNLLPSPSALLLYEPFWSMISSHEPLRDLDGDFLLSKFKSDFGRLLTHETGNPLMTLQHLASICPLIEIPRSCKEYSQLTAYSPAAAFRCPSCAQNPSQRGAGRVIITWGSVLEHQERTCFEEPISNFEFSERGCHAGIAVMKALGLNPLVTSTGDVFQLRPHFTCLKCPELMRLPLSMSWEDCISHHVDFAEDPAHLQPSFEVLTVNTIPRRDPDIATAFVDDLYY